MREILFRGKRIDTRDWIYGGLITTQYRAFIVDCENKTSLRSFTTHHADMFDWRSTEIDPCTIGQYTGVKDKNGVKIFDGDTVRYKDALTNKIHFGVVNFADASFRITDGGFHGYRWQDYDVEVIKERHGEEIDG